jgi:two-component system, cell cycle sensor histidine kinase and response regulator CckA
VRRTLWTDDDPDWLPNPGAAKRLSVAIREFIHEIPMSQALRVLILADREEDAELMVRELRKSGFEPQWERVETEAEMDSSLRREWDVILAAYTMPEFDAVRGLQLLKQRALNIPYIVVSGSNGEESAVTAMRMGAADYLLKDRLGRLGPAVSNAITQQRLFATSRQAALSGESSMEAQRNMLQLQVDILDALPAHIAVLDSNGVIIRANRGWLDFDTQDCFHGREFAVGCNYLLACDAAGESGNEYSAQASLGIRRVLSSDIESFELEYSCCPIGNVQHWFRIMVAPLKGQGKESAVVMHVDITDLIHAKEASRRLAAILESTPDFVGLTDIEGNLIYINQSGRELVGIPPEAGDQSLGHISEFHPPWGVDLLSQTAIPEAMRTGLWQGETTLVHRGDGHEIPVSLVVLAHRSASGQVAYLSTMARDITEQRRLEDEIRQAQKMDAVGRLAGGVAHDFNNILTIILGYSDLIQEALTDDDDTKELVQGISEAARRAAVLTRQLLAFSRRQILQPREIHLNTSVLDMQKMLGRLIGEDIELIIELADDLKTIKADPGQIEQVVMNLAINSRDAMPEGGTLRIETKNRDITVDDAHKHPDLTPGNYVELRISDSGRGMNAGTLAHVFEPFFTTKDTGQGSGLGLAMVYGIVKQSEGHIEVSSTLGAGTTFRIFLPQYHEPLEDAASEGEGLPLAHRPATVLLVEDDTSVRRLARYTLQLQGYQVLEAGNGTDALQVSESFSKPIDVLLTDVVMPRMSGRELTEQLVARRPSLKVLYMSGYTDDAKVHQDVLDATGGFLQKPFTPAALLAKLHAVLQQENA